MLTSERKKPKRSKIRYAEYYDLQKTLDSLYADSLKGKVFVHLMELISSEENIRMAYRTIKGNTGSSTAGVDMPETIREKQNYVLAERQESDKRYVLFGGRILNMDEQVEQRLMKNLRAHRVRGGICSDITTCKSDMWNCLECKAFVADTEQTEYYREQIALWREKQVRFSAFPIICENAKRNAGLFESILKSIETDVQRNEANNT